MPRGRPPGSKNKKTLSKSNLFTETKEIIKEEVTVKEYDSAVKKAAFAPVKSQEKYPKCMCCGEPIVSGMCTVQLTSFTGRAYWHRDIPDIIRMCPKCSMMFSDAVQFWFQKHGVPQRLGYKDDYVEDKYG